MTAAPLPDGTLAGYRLVRRLGSGSRASVYLGVGSTGSVALKVFNTDTPGESVAAELDAIGRIDSPHLVRLIDLSSTADGVPIFILERVSRGSVATLLSERPSIALGEAVTLLAPLATLVGELHDAGVAHGGITPAAIHLGSEGQPVLLAFGRCTLFEPNGTMAALDTNEAAACDRDALANLALDVLARVRDSGLAARVEDLIDWVGRAPRAYEFPGDLAEHLFSSAEPLPITLALRVEPESEVPARVVPTASINIAATDPHEPPLPSWVPGWAPKLVLESPVELIRARAIAAARSVRPRFWVIAGAVVLMLLLAITVVPSGGSHSASVRPPTESPTPGARSPTSPALPDDPLRASQILFDRRATCFRDLSILCLDGVDEPSSAAFANDSTTIQQVQEGGEAPKSTIVSGTVLTLVERLGDTALVGLGTGNPASILVIRTRAGWRIRDYLTGRQATPAPVG